MSKDEKHPLWDIMVFIILAAALPWWAFVFKTAWSWFVVPLGVPAIGMAHAVGLSLIMKAIVPHQAKNKNDGWTETERDTFNIGAALLGPLLTLTFAWIAHNLM